MHLGVREGPEQAHTLAQPVLLYVPPEPAHVRAVPGHEAREIQPRDLERLHRLREHPGPFLLQDAPRVEDDRLIRGISSPDRTRSLASTSRFQ